MTLTLVTGGARSGKSRYAESLLAPDAAVLYVATGAPRDDADWARRVASHKERRPGLWSTLETTAPESDSTARNHDGPVLLDCLGTWITGVLDDTEAWERPARDWTGAVTDRVDTLVSWLAGRRHDTVVVTNEVGWGVVPAYRSGRVFADELGTLNQRVAEVADVVVVTVSGIPIAVKGELP